MSQVVGQYMLIVWFTFVDGGASTTALPRVFSGTDAYLQCRESSQATLMHQRSMHEFYGRKTKREGSWCVASSGRKV